MEEALAQQTRRSILAQMRTEEGKMSWLRLPFAELAELEKMEAEGLVERFTDNQSPLSFSYRLLKR